MSSSYIIWAIVISALVTIFLRALPFILFRSEKAGSEALDFIAENLPVAVIAILIVYSVSHVSFSSFDGWIKEAVSIGCVVALHLLKKNTLLSVLGGTAVYMAMIHLGF
ncbi:MAG: AzlD domain-containing protein [Sphaerochaetaceae bacterium]|nr:AzlD domain-containing protein [Sphaerochaetaceae bacterium]